MKFKIQELGNELNGFNINESTRKYDSIVKTLEIVTAKKLEEVEKRLKEAWMENVKSNSKRVENNLDEFTKKSSYTATAKKTDPDCGTLELP